MSNAWIYRVGITSEEIKKAAGKDVSVEEIKTILTDANFSFDFISTEDALKNHINETLDKPYKYYTSMQEEAPNIFSCSSLISYLYVFAGVWMPSLVIDKFFYFKPIEKNDLIFGDVVFSYNPDDHPLRTVSKDYMPGKLKTEKPVNHLGMYLGDGMILQASGNWYKGKVIIEDLDPSPSFKNIVSYGRVVNDLKEKRFVIQIPSRSPDLRQKDILIKEITALIHK